MRSRDEATGRGYGLPLPAAPSWSGMERAMRPSGVLHAGPVAAHGQRRHGGAEFAERQMIEVSLGGGDARVPEQLLDRDHVAARPERPDDIGVA
jgi:hypothetical protein